MNIKYDLLDIPPRNTKYWSNVSFCIKWRINMDMQLSFIGILRKLLKTWFENIKGL